MTDESPIKTAKEGISIVADIIKAAGDNPSVKEAAGNLGQTAVTLTKTINNVLLPLAAINFAFDKARTYFADKFQTDLAAKTANIPDECIIEPKASIAGPTLQGLAFTHEEPNLKDMYLNLLATAMDNRVSADAHPAFVEIIKQLNSEEAGLVQGILQSSDLVAIVQIRINLTGNKGFNVGLRHLMHLRSGATQTPIENPRLPAMIDNWIRLGLVEVMYDQWIVDPQAYSWVEQRPEFIKLSTSLNSEERKVEFEKGTIQRTELGQMFAKAVGLTK